MIKNNFCSIGNTEGENQKSVIPKNQSYHAITLGPGDNTPVGLNICT